MFFLLPLTALLLAFPKKKLRRQSDRTMLQPHLGTETYHPDAVRAMTRQRGSQVQPQPFLSSSGGQLLATALASRLAPPHSGARLATDIAAGALAAQGVAKALPVLSSSARQLYDAWAPHEDLASAYDTSAFADTLPPLEIGDVPPISLDNDVSSFSLDAMAPPTPFSLGEEPLY